MPFVKTMPLEGMDESTRSMWTGEALFVRGCGRASANCGLAKLCSYKHGRTMPMLGWRNYIRYRQGGRAEFFNKMDMGNILSVRRDAFLTFSFD
jgi:hypothetical protein